MNWLHLGRCRIYDTKRRMEIRCTFGLEVVGIVDTPSSSFTFWFSNDKFCSYSKAMDSVRFPQG